MTQSSPSREEAKECSPRRKPWDGSGNERAPEGRKSYETDSVETRLAVSHAGHFGVYFPARNVSSRTVNFFTKSSRTR